MFGNERADRKACGRTIRSANTAKKENRMARKSIQSKNQRMAQPASKHVSYTDCLQARAAVPTDAIEKLLFQFLMVGGMVTFMATFNGWRHSGMAFFTTHHWIYPLVACIALSLRIFFMDHVMGFIGPRFIDKHFKGFAKTVVFTATNICIMAPIMTSITTLMLYGTQNYLFNIADNLPISMVVSFFVNIFIVAPIVKMVYNNYLTTERGARWLNYAERTAMPWMAIFNS